MNLSEALIRSQVFVSYSHKDARWLQRLQVHFQPFERQSKIERWDDTSIQAGAHWREEISQALNCAKVAVLLVSADFLASDFIVNEELPQLLAAAENDGVVIIPVILSPCVFDTIESLSQYQSINPPSQPLSGLSKTKREQILVKLARAVSEALAAKPPSPTPTAATPGRLCGVPARNPLFCGRDRLLAEISKTLDESQRVALCGLAGIGKTEAAIEYVYRNRQSYSLTLWIKSDSQQQLLASLVAAAKFLELPEAATADQSSAIDAMCRWLARERGWLAVFDDVDDLDLLKAFLPSSENGSLIIATRMQATAAIAPPIEVDVLSLEEGATFLLRRARVLSSGSALDSVASTDYATAKLIASETGCLPLALDQAGGYLEETGCDLDSYLKLWSTHRSRLLAHSVTSSLRSADSVAATWSLSFNALEKSKPQAVDLLNLLAFLHPDAIPEDVLSEGSSLLGSELAAILADPWQLNDVIKDAIKFSLLRRDAKTRALRMHRLFQATLRDRLDANAQALWAGRAVQVVERGFPEAKFANWVQCERLTAHALVCADNIKSWRIKAPYSARLLHELAYYLYQRGRYQEGAPLIEAALGMRQSLYGAQHSDYARTLDIKGLLLQAQGQLGDAELSIASAMTILEKELGTEHQDVARVASHLASLKLDQNLLTDAETFFQKALAITQRTSGPEHPSVAQLMNNLAAIYFKRGDYAQAEKMFERALAIREKVLPVNHPSVAQGYNNLAAACARQARYADAEGLYLKALSMREATLGPDHPHVAETLYNVALLYVKQRSTEQAEACLNRALAIHENCEGPDHPSTADVLASLAEVRLLQRRVDDAKQFYERALRIRERALGEAHPDVGRTLVGLADVYQAESKVENAQTLLDQALTILEAGLHPDHPDIRDCRAKLLRTQNREVQAG